MEKLEEKQRHPAPATRIQPLAFFGDTLWAGSWDTSHLYAIDPQTWKVTDQVAAPGIPYGLARVGDVLRVVIAIGDEEDRFLFRFVPGKGFDADSKMACPDFTGSHLASDGTTLYLGQMGNRRIVVLNDAGEIERAIALPTRIGGMGFGPAGFYVIAADEEFEKLELGTLDVRTGNPALAPIAPIPWDARSLVYMGDAGWTSLREAGEIVSFTVG